MNGFPKEQIAAIALGSNLGDSEATLKSAIATLQQHPLITPIKVSPWYQTKPLGPPQPDYINGCIAVHYQGQAENLMQTLLDIEQQHGRERTLHWGPRTLDLDFLFLGSTILNTKFLTLPHPHMHERHFVLAPLANIYPEWNHPHLNQSVIQLLNQVEASARE